MPGPIYVVHGPVTALPKSSPAPGLHYPVLTPLPSLGIQKVRLNSLQYTALSCNEEFQTKVVRKIILKPKEKFWEEKKVQTLQQEQTWQFPKPRIYVSAAWSHSGSTFTGPQMGIAFAVYWKCLIWYTGFLVSDITDGFLMSRVWSERSWLSRMEILSFQNFHSNCICAVILIQENFIL